MDENYEELFERIRTKCRQQRWYGPDFYNPFRIIEDLRVRQQKAIEELERQRREHPMGKGWFSYVEGRSTTFYWYDRKGKQYEINLQTDLEAFPLRTDFEYAPATEEELAAIEEWQGHPLPPLLRTLYARVANGGFGPGYGLGGVSIPVARVDRSEGTSIWKQKRGVDLSIYVRRYGLQSYLELPWYVWPDSLFTLCHWGCGYFSFVDGVSGRVFYGGAGKEGFRLYLQALSLAEWFEGWLKGENLERKTYAQVGGSQSE